LQFDGAEKRPSAITVQSFKTPFGVRRTSNSTALFLSTGKMRCASFYFERSCPKQRPRALALHALKPQEPRSSGPWTTAEPVLASRGVVGSWQAPRVIFVVVGKVAAPPSHCTHP
jgi:hypothetical protein